jgi:hypothetical protein
MATAVNCADSGFGESLVCRVGHLGPTLYVAVFFSTGLVKLISLGSGERILRSADPVFGVLNGHLLFWVGVAEIAAGVFAALSARTTVKHLMALALAGNFLFYRAFKYAIGHRGFCSCLGVATGWLHLSAGAADLIALALCGLVLVAAVCGMRTSLGTDLDYGDAARVGGFQRWVGTNRGFAPSQPLPSPDVHRRQA